MAKISRRTNPWPAYADLFAALLVVTFAGFIMMTGAYKIELDRYQKTERETLKIRQEADRIFSRVFDSLNKGTMQNVVRKCGDDTCIDLYIHFEQNRSSIGNKGEADTLGATCTVLRSAFDSLSSENKKDIELIIEGHTDRQQATQIADRREQYLFNWNLSAERATSVAYVFQQCGLRPPDYQIVAIGYADSMPLCSEHTPDCYARNRRTTLRLRADTRRIEERLTQVSK